MATEDADDAQTQLIDSLRAQINDLFTQVTQLNAKLIKSYDRVSDIEDELHVSSTNLKSSTRKVSELELERTQHLNAINTGILVERDHVTSELTKLMERATEEAAQRGQAESARQDIEKDLDDLSASLFDQANTMVAEARYARSLSERKVADAELALKGAEDAVASMQKQMQAMQEEVQHTPRSNAIAVANPTSRQLMSMHQPYQEFLLFLAHLRSVHVSRAVPAPTMTSLLQQPFLARLLTEDSDPTLRLDLAPSLSWLSRRSVLAAIHSGQLQIEPMSTPVLLQELNSSNSSTNLAQISCALCGTAITPSTNTSSSSTGTWGRSYLPKLADLRTLSTSSASASSSVDELPSQLHVFRVFATPPSSATVSQPQPPPHPALNHLPINMNNGNAAAGPYPLCPNGWCLQRLRLTCSLWSYIRRDIVDKVWEESVPDLPTPPALEPPTNGDAVVHKKKRSLWNLASSFGERAAATLSGSGDTSRPTTPTKPIERRLPPLPAPLPISPPPTALPVEPTAADASPEQPIAPPLPRRSEGRARPATPSRNPRRSIDAHLTPLPESRPGTPLTPVKFATTEDAAPSPTAVAFAATPTSPTAPPPLPRRAAKRISLVGASRPVTPKVEEQPKVEEEAAEAAEPVAETSTTPVPTEDVKEEANDAPSETTSQPETVVLDTEASVKPPPFETRDSSQDKTDGSSTYSSAPASPVSAKDEFVKVDAIPETDESATPLQVEIVEPDVNTASAEDANGTSDSHAHVESPAADIPEVPKLGPVVGDATWEERTWRDVVHLREQLFWARVGVRSSS